MGYYKDEGNWREDLEIAWDDYIWGNYDRTDKEEEKAKDKLFKLFVKARDIQLISLGRKPRTNGFIIEDEKE